MSIQWKKKYLRPVIPICVLIYMAYAEWAYSYLFCYQHVYKSYNNRASMIAFLVIANIFWFIAIVSWVFIFFRGPGTLPMKIQPYELSDYVVNGEKYGNKNKENDADSFDSSTPISTPLNDATISPPEIFECDYNGLPYWCFNCSSLKPLRSHHSSATDTCIPMFDHFCTFVGFAIGKNNYFSFITFVITTECLIFFTYITIIVYAGIWNQLHAALIVFVILTGILFLLVGNLLMNLIIDLLNGDTTIERMDRIRRKKGIKKHTASDTERYVNVQHPNSPRLRLIVKISVSDKPYNKGFWNNLKLWHYNFNKFSDSREVSEFQNSMFSDTFKQDILDRINRGEYVVFASQTKLKAANL